MDLLEQLLLYLLRTLGLLGLTGTQIRQRLGVVLTLLNERGLKSLVLLLVCVLAFLEGSDVLPLLLQLALLVEDPLLQLIDFAVLLGQSLAKIVDHLEDVFGDELGNARYICLQHLDLNVRRIRQALLHLVSFVGVFGCLHARSPLSAAALKIRILEVPYRPNVLLVHQLSILSTLRLVSLRVRGALMLVALEHDSEVRLPADVALHEDLVASCLKMLGDLHTKLDLLALWARQAFLRAVLLQMLLELKLRELLRLGALVRAMVKACFAVPLEMVVQLVVTDRLGAAVRMVGTFELQLVQLLLVELVDLAWRLRERVPTVLLVADVVQLLRASLANNVLARLAFNSVHHDVGAFGAEYVLIDVDCLGIGRGEQGRKLAGVVRHAQSRETRCNEAALEYRLGLNDACVHFGHGAVHVHGGPHRLARQLA